MARITLPEGNAPEVVRALSMRPELAAAVGAMDAAVWASKLDWRLHELVRMRIAQINQCTVCLGWRTPMGVEAGATDELLESVADWRDAPGFTDAERVAIEYTERFATDSAGIDDDLVARLGQQLSAGEIVELTLVIGKYVAFGRFMQVLGLDQTCDLSFDDTGKVVAT